MKALGGVHVYLHSQADLPKNLIDLAYLRTSQINGCAYCIDMHSHDLIAQGVPVSKLLLVSAWHEAGDIFDMRERGVLAWTETVTDVARTGVPDDAYAAALAIFSQKELADLTVAVGVMGAYNRLAISFHQRPAARKGEYGRTAHGAKRPFQMLAALGWPKTVSVVRKAIKGEQGKGG
jgi:AhpD family alkylhydroperoxidase